MTPNLWSLLQRRLRQQLDPDDFSTWIRPLKVRSESDRKLVLLAPNTRFLHALEEHFRPQVDRALAGLDSPGFEVLFSLEEREEASAEPEQPQLALATQFNPKYRFQNFVVGSSNQFAHAAARAVAEAPSQSYNPLFLYGGVGLGKTHLLHAIGTHIEQHHPQLRVMYIPAEQFVNELINSIRFDRMPAFRERYRTIDVLLIDDVQFLANKERTQEEFFHTFNTLYTSQKQIILSSDSSPRNIPTLEERLRSRFEWGLIADIQPPDLETKVAILRRKADLEGIHVPNEVSEFIAQQVRSNIRELEGMLNRVIAFSSLTGRPLSLELTRETLRDILPEDGHRIEPNDVVRKVAHHYGLSVKEIKSKTNSHQVVFPRKVAMYLLRQLTGLSYPDIGKLFNDKHHSTVMYAVKDIEERRGSDTALNGALQKLEKQYR
jgi:chromosomal replication initiator protein